MERLRKTGILLINLGSPDAPTPQSVRRYLAQFLSDPRVIDTSPVVRWLLLHLVILRVRPAKSAAAYQSIWTERGSPLLFHTADLTEAVKGLVEERHPGKFDVRFAMRYGSPSIRSALDEFYAAGVRSIRILPLFPQNASATTGSILEELYRIGGSYPSVFCFEVIEPFFDKPAYYETVGGMARARLDDFYRTKKMKIDHLLFSYHGLPERQIRRSDPNQVCLNDPGCCDTFHSRNANCYRAQCYQTSRLIADEIGLESFNWGISFQSRLGRDPWIRPYTESTIRSLARMGLKNIAVIAPSFVADCLETLEEIEHEYASIFKKSGGMNFLYLPSLNAEPEWAEALLALLGIPETGRKKS